MEDNNNINILKDADISSGVLTLQELCERRKILLQKKRQILNKGKTPSQTIAPRAKELEQETQCESLTSEYTTLTTIPDPVTTANDDVIIPNVVYEDLITHVEVYENIITPIDANVLVMGHGNNNFDFSSDDSVADPTYVALSEITNLKPMSPYNIEWFPEREIEEISKNFIKRKRKGDPNNWQRMKNKRQRMTGQEYIGFKKEGTKYVQNESKPARTMGPICMSIRCFSGKVMYCPNLTEEVRSEIFKTFWKISWQEKKMYVSSMVDKKPVSRKTIKSFASRRSDSKVYYLKVKDKKERVCLKTFLETLGIKEWTVRYWLGEKSFTNNESVTRETANCKETKKELVKKYLSELPKLPSHYCRQSTSKLYLEPIIQSKSQLYRIYVEYSESHNRPVASRKLFEEVIIEQNIGLFQPKKDACDTCCAHKAGNVSHETHQKHTELKNMARAQKNEDKTAAQKGDIIHAITADLQAVKLCPCLNASALYFKTKLAVHNFSIYNLGNNKVTCYWFDETACDLKATTYASFFVDYLSKLLDEDLKDVVIFTDGCTAQNRNNVVSNALLRLAMSKNIVITQKYLEKGHTQMEVDSVHSVIERKLKNREIYLPSQYATITKEARKTPCPYDVITPDYTFFKDFSFKDYQVYESIRPGRGAGDHCVVDIRAMRYNPNGTIDYKLNFADDFTPLPRRPKKVSSLTDSVPPLYSSRQRISKAKYDHLQELKCVIPNDCHDFYNNLPFK